MGVTVVCETLWATCAVYEVITELNVPILTFLRLRDFSVASEEGGAALVTVTV